MKDKKGIGAKLIVLIVIIVILVGVVIYIANLIKNKNKGTEQDIADLTSDHLDDAFAELEEADFNVPVS